MAIPYHGFWLGIPHEVIPYERFDCNLKFEHRFELKGRFCKAWAFGSEYSSKAGARMWHGRLPSAVAGAGSTDIYISSESFQSALKCKTRFNSRIDARAGGSERCPEVRNASLRMCKIALSAEIRPENHWTKFELEGCVERVNHLSDHPTHFPRFQDSNINNCGALYAPSSYLRFPARAALPLGRYRPPIARCRGQAAFGQSLAAPLAASRSRAARACRARPPHLQHRLSCVQGLSPSRRCGGASGCPGSGSTPRLFRAGSTARTTFGIPCVVDEFVRNPIIRPLAATRGVAREAPSRASVPATCVPGSTAENAYRSIGVQPAAARAVAPSVPIGNFNVFSHFFCGRRRRRRRSNLIVAVQMRIFLLVVLPDGDDANG
ncbi:hypothetical protein B0H16DRAFT_1694635 [Mycena metata]|uniref:Uncharacterized protein n=1 Tax=Mycena metata TaxID=1033252 RepID=A0AAD7IAS7_9AGAR|nr:hypothetical protein B0H16DRAFT_1694635 [Mycena metata]